MSCKIPECLGDYDFELISAYARKRFVEGYDTMSLLEKAASDYEKEQIALVSLLDVDDEKIMDLELSCRHASECRVIDCRNRLREIIGSQLAQ